MKAGPLKDLCHDYTKRLTTPFQLIEYDGRKKNLPALDALKNDRKSLILLDERGKDLSTQGFYETMNTLYHEGKDPHFIIGGPDGHPEALRGAACHILRLGAMTWPHMLVRLLFLEQWYRLQQIHKGHPYHRE